MLARLFALLAIAFSTNTYALTEACPVNPLYKGMSCQGSVRVINATQLNLYKNTLNVKKNIARNLIIDFDLSSSEAITISKVQIDSITDPCLKWR